MFRSSFILLLTCGLTISSAAATNNAALTKLDRLIAQQLQVEQATAMLSLQSQQSSADNQRLILLYQQEQQALTEALARYQQQQDDVAEQRSELLQLQLQQEQRSEQYQQQLWQGQQLLDNLWPLLPPPLQHSLAEQRQLLADEQLSMSERYSGLINTLTRLEEFDRTINLHRGVLTHEAQQWHAEQLYIGLAQGYYRLPDGSGFGIGYQQNGQWQWQAVPQLSDSIERAFAIYQGRQSVDFVTLPLPSIQHETQSVPLVSPSLALSNGIDSSNDTPVVASPEAALQEIATVQDVNSLQEPQS